jgi:hypothetical protein
VLNSNKTPALSVLMVVFGGLACSSCASCMLLLRLRLLLSLLLLPGPKQRQDALALSVLMVLFGQLACLSPSCCSVAALLLLLLLLPGPKQCQDADNECADGGVWQSCFVITCLCSAVAAAAARSKTVPRR